MVIQKYVTEQNGSAFFFPIYTFHQAHRVTNDI